MTFRYKNTTGTHTFDIDLGQAAVRLGSMTSGLVTCAEIGQAGAGALDIDDPGGVLSILGLQYILVTESALPGGSDILWYGYIGDRTVKRGGSERASLRTAGDRVWSLGLQDLNSILTLRRVNSGNRSAESAGTRLTWLLGLSNCPVHDNGFVTYPSHAMDANDYTDSTFSDVLSDIQAAVAYNFWAEYDQSAGNIGLWFLDPDSSTYSTTARISNVLADVDGTTTFWAFDDAELTRSPSRLASGVSLRYSGGRVRVTSSATSDTYAVVDQVAPMSSVKSSAKATAVANRFLAQSEDESDRISCRIRVPLAHANDIRAGHLMDVRFSHLPGYENFTAVRVMSRAVLQDEESDDFFNLALELAPIVPEAPPCSVYAYDYLTSTVDGLVVMTNTATGSYPILSSYGYAGDNVAAGPYGLMVYAQPPGASLGNTRPCPNFTPGQANGAGGWAFRDYNNTHPGQDGGLGGADGAYKLFITVIGPGTLTVYATSASTADYELYKVATPGFGPDTLTLIASGAMTFPSITLDVPDDGFCVHYLAIRDNGPSGNSTLDMYVGNGSGTAFDWTAA